MKKLPIFTFVLILALIFINGCKTEKPQDEAISQYSIINMHEHIQHLANADKLVRAMDEKGISKTVLVGSPAVTVGSGSGFKGYDENNEELFKIEKKYPGRFISFPTINPADEDKLEKLKGYIGKGADGLKLYSGHSDFYTLALNDSSMHPVYEYLEENNLPVVWHVNGRKFRGEFEAVLNDFPNLTVDCPHFCLLSLRLNELAELLDKYPHLYTDISFGREKFLTAGFEEISGKTGLFKWFFEKYSGRILFGTDMVVTSYPTKTEEWIGNVTQCYKGLLEKEKFNCFLAEEELNGLNLSSGALKKVYEENAERFLNKK